MHNFAQTIFSGMQRAGDRVLLRWPEEGETVSWRADQLLQVASGFSQQLSAFPRIQGKVLIPLQSLTAPRFMALLAVMGFG